MINSVEIVEQKDEDMESEESGEEIELPEGLEKEERKPWPDIFILTASQDWNILIHRLSNGVKIGQFAQEQLWNIFDMSPYEGVRPNYVREWLKQKKQKWLKLIDDRIAAHRANNYMEESKVPAVRLSTKDELRKFGINVNMSMSDGGNSLLGSDDMNSANDDEFYNLDHFESDDEDMKEQDIHKGKNLSQVAVKRRDMTKAQRRKWLDEDENRGKYKIAQ